MVEEKFVKLAEPIHWVLQGEGPNLGKKMLLLRFFGCNLKCLQCDSKQTWESDHYILIKISELINIIHKQSKKYQIKHLLITGGEPQMFQKEIIHIISHCMDFKFDIETSGLMRWKDPFFQCHPNIYFNFSPKIGSLYPGLKAKEWKAFKNLPLKYCLKVVVSTEQLEFDIREIKNFQVEYQIPNDKVYLMPEGVTTERIQYQSDIIINKCFELGFNFSPRLHVLIYGDKKLV